MPRLAAALLAQSHPFGAVRLAIVICVTSLAIIVCMAAVGSLRRRHADSDNGRGS